MSCAGALGSPIDSVGQTRDHCRHPHGHGVHVLLLDHPDRIAGDTAAFLSIRSARLHRTSHLRSRGAARSVDRLAQVDSRRCVCVCAGVFPPPRMELQICPYKLWGIVCSVCRHAPPNSFVELSCNKKKSCCIQYMQCMGFFSRRRIQVLSLEEGARDQKAVCQPSWGALPPEMTYRPPHSVDQVVRRVCTGQPPSASGGGGTSAASMPPFTPTSSSSTGE